jgi:Ca-activated chloride channel homolog
MRSATFQTIDRDPLLLESVKAQGRVVGRMLDMRLEQRFRNPLPHNVEVVYTFPLPWRAVLLGLEVELNGQTLTAEVQAKATARAIYEETLSEGDTALLLEVNHDGSYTLELGNLMASEACVVRLHYVQTLQPEQGSLRLMLPTTLAPRYGDARVDGRFEPHAVPEVDATAEYPFDIHLTLHGELAQARVASPSHSVATRYTPPTGPDSPASLAVRLAAAAWLDRDFILLIDELAHHSQGLAAWDALDPGNGVVMVAFSPKLPPQAPQPVQMKVLVDCSGSMAGDSIQSARSALQRILTSLQPDDRYSLTRFGSCVEHRSKALWKVAPASLAAARQWVEALQADLGGTDMEDAIHSTLALPGAERCDVLLITDGHIHAIDNVIEAAQQSGHRFFVVGIGSSVSEGLLRRLALETGGSCELVAPAEAVAPAIERLFARMRALVVNGARVQWPQAGQWQAVDSMPLRLFDSDDITVYARVCTATAEPLTGTVRLMGQPQGAAAEICLAECTPTLVSDEANTLARLAAYQRYTQAQQTTDSPSAARNKELATLAEKYQLVTPHTSLLLVKQRAEGEKAQDMPRLQKVKGMLAAGRGGYGSVVAMSIPDPSTMFSRSVAPSMNMRFGKNPSPTSKPIDREKLRAFIDSIDTGPAATETAKGPQDPPKTDEFWNDGSAYTNDPSEYHKYAGLTPAGLVEWLRLNPDTDLDLADILRMDAPAFLVKWLLDLICTKGYPDQAVIQTFQELMQAHEFTFVQTVFRAIATSQPAPERKPLGSPEALQPLRAHMVETLAGITAERWPHKLVRKRRFED